VNGGIQKITFYSELLDQLSDAAALAVLAHELAHAWLNEHVAPEQSKSREKEADRLAKSWGFTEELDALANETE
jgi:Zn-dependent protease with chaperone function